MKIPLLLFKTFCLMLFVFLETAEVSAATVLKLDGQCKNTEDEHLCQKGQKLLSDTHYQLLPASGATLKLEGVALARLDEHSFFRCEDNKDEPLHLLSGRMRMVADGRPVAALPLRRQIFFDTGDVVLDLRAPNCLSVFVLGGRLSVKASGLPEPVLLGEKQKLTLPEPGVPESLSEKELAQLLKELPIELKDLEEARKNELPSEGKSLVASPFNLEGNSENTDQKEGELQDSKKEQKAGAQNKSSSSSSSSSESEETEQGTSGNIVAGQGSGKSSWFWDLLSGALKGVLALAFVALVFLFLIKQKKKKEGEKKSAQSKKVREPDEYEGEDIFVIRESLTRNHPRLVTEKITHILGNVEDGASIHARHKLVVKGTFQGAHLLAEDNVSLRGGINGQGRAKLVIKGDLRTSYASEADIFCTGLLVAEKTMRNCRVVARKVEVEGKSLLGGLTAALESIICPTLGSDFAETRVLLGQEPWEVWKSEILGSKNEEEAKGEEEEIKNEEEEEGAKSGGEEKENSSGEDKTGTVKEVAKGKDKTKTAKEIKEVQVAKNDSIKKAKEAKPSVKSQSANSSSSRALSAGVTKESLANSNIGTDTKEAKDLLGTEGAEGALATTPVPENFPPIPEELLGADFNSEKASLKVLEEVITARIEWLGLSLDQKNHCSGPVEIKLERTPQRRLFWRGFRKEDLEKKD